MSASTATATSSETPATFAYAAWLIATAAMLGSLFFGEVMKLPPCTLCWYQRICLFPLPFVLGIGIALRDPRLVAYATPFVGAGLAISLYHNLLYYGVIPETLSPCTSGVSCATRQLELLGFITIPLLAGAGFVSIAVALFLHHKQLRSFRP